MKNRYVILLLICILASFLAGYRTGKVLDNSVAVKTDTIIRIDTVTERYPEPVKEVVTRYISLSPDTVIKYIKGDTVFLPVLQKEYSTPDYQAWVSGYNAALDSITIFPKTVYITKTVPARRWGLGVSAGYGAGRSGLSPYIGVGVCYRIW